MSEPVADSPRKIGRNGTLLGLAATLVLSGVLLASTAGEKRTAATILPAITLTTLRNADQTINLADLRGTPLVINFFFSDCPPCLQELPLIERVAKSTRSDVRFVGIDHGEARSKGQSIADRFGLDYTLLSDETASYAPQVGALAFPTTLFVDRQGQIVGRHLGAMTPNDLNSGLKVISHAIP